MIVGSYNLTLYCRNGVVSSDHGECKGPQSFRFNQSMHDFYDNTEAGARAQAREKGWKFHRDGDVSCPWCAGRKEDQN